MLLRGNARHGCKKDPIKPDDIFAIQTQESQSNISDKLIYGFGKLSQETKSSCQEETSGSGEVLPMEHVVLLVQCGYYGKKTLETYERHYRRNLQTED